MNAALFIATLIAPGFFMWKHNQQARHVLEARLFKLGVNQGAVRSEFRTSKSLSIGNIIVVIGADVLLTALFFNRELNHVLMIGVMILGVIVALAGIALKAVAISRIQKGLFGK